MAGHSKWAQIKRKKAVVDAKRGKLFTKLIRELTVAAREAGGDPAFNPRLRLAVDQAKAANMPQENIDRAIKRGTGELEGVSYEEVTYEGYGPGGVALFLECLTDNPNRTVSEIRHVLEKHGGNLGTSGSVAWQFQRLGQIYVSAVRYTEDSVLEAALEAGADDVSLQGDEFVVTTQAGALHRVQEGLGATGVEWSEADLAMVPRSETSVEGDSARKLVRLVEALEELDDVQEVYSNADVDESILAEA